MGLNRTVMKDMTDSQSALGERTGNQQTTVAIERLALGAHQADTVLARIVLQPAESVLKFGIPRHRFIIGHTIAIETLLTRPAAQRTPTR